MRKILWVTQEGRQIKGHMAEESQCLRGLKLPEHLKQKCWIIHFAISKTKTSRQKGHQFFRTYAGQIDDDSDEASFFHKKVRKKMTDETLHFWGEERLTFCCSMDGSSCEGPRYGQAAGWNFLDQKCQNLRIYKLFFFFFLNLSLPIPLNSFK